MEIAVQQYMVRDYVRSTQNVSLILNEIKAAGFSHIEMCGFLTYPNPMLKGTPFELKEALDWPELLDKAGIKVCSIHELIENIIQNPQKIISNAKKLGTDTIVVAGSRTTDYTNLDSVKELIKNLNTAGRALKEKGIKLLYHNHNVEIAKMSVTNDRSLNIIYNEIDPNIVNLQLDVFWLQSGGMDPKDWVEKLGSRIKALHLNDAGPADGKPGDMMRNLVGKELGSGNLNLEYIIDKSSKNGCKTFILETHDNWVNDSAIESLRISGAYLKKVMCL